MKKNVAQTTISDEELIWNNINTIGLRKKRGAELACSVPLEMDKMTEWNLSIQFYPAWDLDYPYNIHLLPWSLYTL